MKLIWPRTWRQWILSVVIGLLTLAIIDELIPR